jgi:membrane dipeptidase
VKGHPVVDLHEDISWYYSLGDRLDFPLRGLSEDVPDRHGDIPKYGRADVAIVFAAIFCLTGTFSPGISKQLAKGYDLKEFQRAVTPRAAHSTSLEHIKTYYALQRMNSKHVRIIRTPGDIDESLKSPVGFLISLEGAYALEDPYDLDLFYNMGLRSLGLTWNFDTIYAATCMSKRDYGLTGSGEELVDRCNDLGVIIDLVHASKKTQLEVTEVSKLPVMNSHSLSKRMYDVARNLDDKTLESFSKNKGVVGAIFDKNMIGREKDLHSLMEHMKYVYDSYGPDILAIGTDYFGFPKGNAATGLEDISKIGRLFTGLQEAGLGDEDIEKVAYKNAIRVMKANARRWA